jgi:anti-sigma factor RsiW
MTMQCEEVRRLVDLYNDDQLDVERSIEFEEHLEGCPPCAQVVASARSLSEGVRSSGIYREMPAGMSARIRSVVLEEAGISEQRSMKKPSTAPRTKLSTIWWRPALIGLAAVLILAVFIWRWVPYGIRSGDQNPLLAQEVLDSHVRSLMADHLFDVPSTDQHTVKPWFDGKLDFAPPVIDLVSDGFELAGGRLDYINGRPVATTVYRRRKHIVNLMMWPENGEAAPSATIRNGYNLLHWKTGGMEYWAVSDLNLEELREFVALIRSRAPAVVR